MEEGQREFVAALRSQGLSSGFSPGDLRFQSVYGLHVADQQAERPGRVGCVVRPAVHPRGRRVWRQGSSQVGPRGLQLSAPSLT